MAVRSHRSPRQLDLFRDTPDGDLLLLLARLEHAAFAGAARGRIRDVVEELRALRHVLASTVESCRPSRAGPPSSD